MWQYKWQTSCFDNIISEILIAQIVPVHKIDENNTLLSFTLVHLPYYLMFSILFFIQYNTVIFLETFSTMHNSITHLHTNHMNHMNYL